MGGLWVGALLVLLYSATQGSVLVTIDAVGRWAERAPENQKNWEIIGLVLGLGCLVIFLSLLRVLYQLLHDHQGV